MMKKATDPRHRRLREMRKSSKSERIHNRVWCWLVAAGLVPSSWPGRPKIGSVVLELKGRRSGVTRRVPVTWIELDGNRYLVAMLGEQSDWVHNARASGGAAVFRRGKARRVTLEELPPEQRAPILRAWLGRTGLSSIPRKYLGIDRHAGIEEFEQIAPGWPVFRIADATPTNQA
jgi:deazaflavin-dependent oxidoreductase (nitroreductase family)